MLLKRANPWSRNESEQFGTHYQGMVCEKAAFLPSFVEIGLIFNIIMDFWVLGEQGKIKE